MKHKQKFPTQIEPFEPWPRPNWQWVCINDCGVIRDAAVKDKYSYPFHIADIDRGNPSIHLVVRREAKHD